MLNMICFPIFKNLSGRIEFHCDVILRNVHIFYLIMQFIKFSFSLQVRDLVEKCTCPSQFPMIRVSEGKYRIGDTKVLIFVRVSTKLFMKVAPSMLANFFSMPQKIIALKINRKKML